MFRTADVVIERKTLPTRREMKGPGRYAITFRVEEYWKGSPGRTLTLYGLDGGTDCLGDGDYQIGRNYLVYAVEQEVKDAIFPRSSGTRGRMSCQRDR